MLPEAVDRLLALPDDAAVLDVGGWAAPLNRADWVIDAMPFETRGAMGFSYGGARERFDASSWLRRDVCDPEPWPFEDGRFDVAVCVTTLEDLRDPVRVCREMARVAREAYVEVPTPIAELLWDAPGEGPWLGHRHHHWICMLGDDAGEPGIALSASGDRGSDRDAGSEPAAAELLGGAVEARTRPAPARIRFAFKQHSLHQDRRLRVTPSMAVELAPREQLQGLWWSGDVDVAERLLIAETLHEELAAAVAARFPRSRAEDALRRTEGAVLGRGAEAVRPLRDRIGTQLRRRRNGTVADWDLGLTEEHVRAGLGRPRGRR